MVNYPKNALTFFANGSLHNILCSADELKVFYAYDIMKIVVSERILKSAIKRWVCELKL